MKMYSFKVADIESSLLTFSLNEEVVNGDPIVNFECPDEMTKEDLADKIMNESVFFSLSFEKDPINGVYTYLGEEYQENAVSSDGFCCKEIQDGWDEE